MILKSKRSVWVLPNGDEVTNGDKVAIIVKCDEENSADYSDGNNHYVEYEGTIIDTQSEFMILSTNPGGLVGVFQLDDIESIDKLEEFSS